ETSDPPVVAGARLGTRIRRRHGPAQTVHQPAPPEDRLGPRAARRSWDGVPLACPTGRGFGRDACTTPPQRAANGRVATYATMRTPASHRLITFPRAMKPQAARAIAA